jgi:hypothetical protein
MYFLIFSMFVNPISNMQDSYSYYILHLSASKINIHYARLYIFFYKNGVSIYSRLS